MNDSERAVYDAFVKKGYVVLRNGWPDFLVLSKEFSGGFALELKSDGDRLSDQQKAMHTALARFGIAVLTVYPNAVESILRKHGRHLLMPKSIEAIKGQIENLDCEMHCLRAKLADLQKEMDAASVICDGISNFTYKDPWSLTAMDYETLLRRQKPVDPPILKNGNGDE